MRHTQPVPLLTPITNGNDQHQPNGNGPRANANGQPTTSGQNQFNGQHAEKSGFIAMLDEAQAVQNMLRDALNRTNQLIGGLKQYRRHAKTMASTLTALRQLETVEA